MLAALSEVLRPEIFLQIGGSASELILKEDDVDAKLKKLYVKRLPLGSIAIELDHKPKKHMAQKFKAAAKQLSWLVHGSHALANKKCDAIILVPRGAEYNDVYFLDLKSSYRGSARERTEFKKQLGNSKLYFDYICTLMKSYHGYSSDWRYHYVVVHADGELVHKAPVQQNSSVFKWSAVDGVKCLPVSLGGRNNSEAILNFSLIER